MRIFINIGGGKNFPLEVESFDTIGYVKGLIVEKKGYRPLDYMLLFEGKRVENNLTLADYNVQNDSSFDILPTNLGCMHVFIKPFSDNPFSVLASESDTIEDVKARIQEKTGIPVDGQRLMFSGKELHDGDTLEDCGIRHAYTLRLVRLRADGDDAVDIADVQARRKLQAALAAKADGTGNQDRGFSSRGANRVDGVESFWDEEDFGLAWKRSRSLISPYDTVGFESKSRRTLAESVANDCVRTLNVTAFMESQLEEYEDKLSVAEEEVKRLTDENGGMKNKIERLWKAFDTERSTAALFLESEAGRRYIACLKRQAAKSGVDEFKESAAFKEIVMNRAMSVYDDVVKECQRLLRESGQVSEDIIQLIDGVDGEGDGQKMAYSMKLLQELDVERSTGVSFLQSEAGRRHIVSLERQAAKSAIEEFKKSAMLNEIVMNRALSVYDDVVNECKRLLHKSGRVSEDIIQLLDHPQDEEKYDEEEEEEESDDDK